VAQEPPRAPSFGLPEETPHTLHGYRVVSRTAPVRISGSDEPIGHVIVQYARRTSDPEATVARVVGLRLKERGWAFVFFMATLNWVANIACLALAIMAVGSPVPWSGLILAWSVGVGAGSFGLTPGGVGVVEAALAAALVAAGVHAPEAVAAVLVYRLISFWLVDAVGWMLYVTTRKRGRPEPLASDSVDLSP